MRRSEAVVVPFGFSYRQYVENGMVREEDVADIRSWCDEFSLPVLSEEQAVLFLFSCDNDTEFTKRTIETAFEIKNSSPLIFDNRRMSGEDIQGVLSICNVCMVPQKTSDGSTILILQAKLKEGDEVKWHIRGLLKLTCMLLEAAMFANPKCEFIIVFDVQHVTMKHITRIKPKVMKIFIQYLQEGLSGKLKAIHIVNMMSILNKLLKVLKPFIKKEVWNMTHFHSRGKNLSSFYKYVPTEYLPEDFGGCHPPLSVLNDVTVHTLTSMEGYFESEEIFRHSMDDREEQ
ncbi:hypothetical protein PPYR_03187 [Photinus pyralis]|uniref:CRAL-TRIO domain-containing protein n=1 Tax=Photinus pyralis TaxID=7054 RepID=A0A5N4A242_PHOPY|nr:clavesin-2-like [Photinus pyralis]KAB0791387.1 hypothetical protein PPYR_03187 [Photinus pyralis]